VKPLVIVISHTPSLEPQPRIFGGELLSISQTRSLPEKNRLARIGPAAFERNLGDFARYERGIPQRPTWKMQPGRFKRKKFTGRLSTKRQSTDEL
jgi:hypothetical protein